MTTALREPSTSTLTTSAASDTVIVPLRTRMFYGAGGICDSVKSVASGLYLLFFYTTVLGLPGTLVGFAAALGLLWDALSDPIIGGLSDRSRSPLRRHGWMAVGSVGMAVGFIALFSPPMGLSTPQLFGWLLATSVLLRTSQSMFTVPYYALGAELSASYDGRTMVAGYRAAAMQVGAMLAAGLSAALFFPAATGQRSRFAAESYASMSIMLGVLMCAAGVVATVGTWRFRKEAGGPSRTTAPWRAVFRNRSFGLLASANIAFFLAMVFSAVLLMYFLTYYAGIGSGRMIAVCQFALYGGAIAGTIAWARLARIRDKHRLYCAASLALAGLLAGLFWVAPPGLLMEPMRYAVLVFGHAAIGAAAAGPAVLAPSMLADVAEEHELLSGHRSDGVFFGVFSAGQQIATGLAAALAGLLVDQYAGLVPSVATQAAATAVRLGVLACFLPAALVLISAAVMLAYNLTRQRVNLVQRQLTEQRLCAP
jgi:GPH family glycoside/pentoside/hexuronide:cation symporter